MSNSIAAARADEFVRSLYRELLNRNPSHEECAYWVARARMEPAEEIYSLFANSDERRAHVSAQTSAPLFRPPGHFYSPVVDVDEILRREDYIYSDEIPDEGIDLRDHEQLLLVRDMAKLIQSFDFPDHKTQELRYYSHNPAFSRQDALILASIIVRNRPKNIIEVGSGYSSAVILDIVERYLCWNCNATFIEPFPALLESLLSLEDRDRVRIIPKFIQDVPLDIFDSLVSGDILFIDTTHVVKTGSDVLHHFERVLPRIAPGVWIHVHDIFHPFEYPKPWVIEDNRSWNEIYYFKKFISYNKKFQIVFFNNYINKKYKNLMKEIAPNFLMGEGTSIWLKKVVT